MYKFEYVLFDLDGTLIDTTPLIFESFRHTVRHHFGRSMEEEELLKFLGIPLRQAFVELYPDQADLLVTTYREFNHANHDNFTGVFIGINRVLEQCARKGVKLGVVTSKGRKLAQRGMELFGINKYMSVFVGLEDTAIHKPQAAPLLKAMELCGAGDCGKVLYVGDSPYDILCARNAGVKSAAVTGWSYLPLQELMDVRPDICLQTPADLLLYI